VLGAGLGDLLLIAAGDDVLVVERGRSGVSVEVPENLDPTRRSGRVRLQNVRVSADDIMPTRGAGVGTGPRANAAGRRSGRWGRRLRRRRRRYAKVRQQFGPHHRHVPGGQAHCANMLVGAESAIAAVWGRLPRGIRGRGPVPAGGRCAAALAFPAYARKAELNIKCMVVSVSPGARLRICTCRRELVTAATIRAVTHRPRCVQRHRRRLRPGEQPGPAARGRGAAHQDSRRRLEIAALDMQAQRDKLIETGYVMRTGPSRGVWPPTRLEAVWSLRRSSVPRASSAGLRITGWCSS